MRSAKISLLALFGLTAIISCNSLHLPSSRKVQNVPLTRSVRLDNNKAVHIYPSTFLRGHSTDASVPNVLPVTASQVSKKVENGFKLRSIIPAVVGGLFAGSLFLSQPALASSVVDAVAAKTSDSGFIQSFLLILVSEIGDKTFFIAGLLAAKYGRLISFAGSMGALIAMTVISTILGQIFHAVPSSLTQGIPFDDYIAIAAFAYFGLKTLYDSSQMEGDSNAGMEEEKAEAEEAVKELTADQKRSSATALLLQVFTLVFAAEIGDRSFLSTIALSAALNPFAVAAGAVGGHGVATGIAVAGGSLMSKYLSEKVVSYIGGSLFLIFAVTTALGIF